MVCSLKGTVGVVALSLVVFSGVAAAAAEVDLALVLAVDVSRSMDRAKLRLQREGYVAAFRDPSLINAITSGAVGKIMVTYVEWSGPNYQVVVVPWTVINNSDAAHAFADKLTGAPSVRGANTSISGALLFATRQFFSSGVQALRRTIDISGDGPNNDGPPVATVRDLVVQQGITINGLPITIPPSDLYGPFSRMFEKDSIRIDHYYEDCVAGGPSSFVISIDDPSQFSSGIRRKLIMEIARTDDRLISAAYVKPEPRVDCLAVETARRPDPSQ